MIFVEQNKRKSQQAPAPILATARLGGLLLCIVLSGCRQGAVPATETPTAGLRTSPETQPRTAISAPVEQHESIGTGDFGTEHEPFPPEAQGSETETGAGHGTDVILLGEYLELRRHCDLLATRLKATLGELYQARDEAGRTAMITSLLGDPLTEARAAGLDLALTRARLGRPVPQVQLARRLLDDPDEDIRASAAVLLAALRDDKAVELLVPRLETETAARVRSAYILSLGAMRDGRAVDVILDTLSHAAGPEAVEAVTALGRLLDAGVVQKPQSDRAAEIISGRYNDRESHEMRAAVLSLMRRLARQRFIPVMRRALDDPAAQVKLEAIRGLGEMKVTGAAEAIARLTGDEDRGIRQAAIETLGLLSATGELPTVLNRTDPATESDPAVRNRAWKTALELMNGADRTMLTTIAASLADRPDALEYRIRILEMLSGRLVDRPPARFEVDLQLAEALIAAGRPAQAAEILESVHNESPPAEMEPQIWLTWIRSLLAADDESAVPLLAKREDEATFSKAVALLDERLAQLDKAQAYQIEASLSRLAADMLAGKLPAGKAAALAAKAEKATARQLQLDTTRVFELARPLASTDAGESDRAAGEIAAMGARAVAPLIDLLRQAVSDEADTAVLQKRILALLAKLAPELTGFNINDTRPRKLEVIQGWPATRGG